MDIQKAISYWQKFRAECFEMLKEGTENDKRTAEEQIPVCDDTITVLQEQAEREKGCEYCKSGHDLSTGNTCEPSLYIQGNTLLALRYDEPDSEAEIHYCPICGRRLK